MQKTRLLFSNVAVQCTEEDLREWIEAREYAVSSVQLIRDMVSGTSPSFAYVQLIETAKLDEAVRSLHEQLLLGCTVHVRQVVPMYYAVA